MLSHSHIRLADSGGLDNGGPGPELEEFGTAGTGLESGNGRHPHHHHHLGMQGPGSWCAGCGCQITERFLLQAVDRCWHTRCLKCHQCGIALSDLGSSCYSRAGMILCRNDYLKLFGSNGTCSGCSLHISATEFVLRSNNNVYHVNCFVCSQCHSPLQPGDRYAMVNGLPVCEGDFPKVFGASVGQQPQQQQQQQQTAAPGGKRGGKKKQPTQKQQQQQQQQQQLQQQQLQHQQPLQQQQQQTAANQSGQLQPVC